MEPYKIIIADDDEIICEGIKNTINWSSINAEIVATANDGEEAMWLIREHKPNLAILDINMPFMDGLEVAVTISKEFSNMKVIVLTAFREFSYAQRAIQCRVFDYLTKPIHNSDLLQSAKNAFEMIEQENSILTNKVNQYYSRLIHGEELDPQILKNECKLCNLNGQFQVAAFEPIYIDRLAQDATQDLKLDSGYEYLKEYFMTEKKVHLVRRPLRLLIIYEVDDEKECNSFYPLLRKSVKDLNEFISADFALSIGSVVTGVDVIRQSYREARNALEYRNDFPVGHMITYNELNKQSIDFLGFFKNCEEQINNAVTEGNSGKIKEAIHNLFYKVEKTKGISNSECAALSIEMLMRIYRDGGDELLNSFLKDNRDSIRSIRYANTIKEIELCVMESMQLLFERTDELLGDSLKIAVTKAVKYINEHYSNPDLCLKDVANEANISSSYMQVLLKKYKDTNFCNYLNTVRMEEAMRLLKKGDKKIYEVAFCTGYNSSQYFSRKFKKHFNIEPREVKI